jgi:hypothetical protein
MFFLWKRVRLQARSDSGAYSSRVARA